MNNHFRALLFVGVYLSACSNSTNTPDASTPPLVLDSGPKAADVGFPDASPPPVDAGPADMGVVDMGMGPPTPQQIASARWQQLGNAPTIRGKQDDLYFVNDQLGFSVNGQGNIYRTRDGGDTWQRVLNQPGTYFRAIIFFDENLGFAGNIGTDYYPGVTDETPLYKTTDGGETWAAVTIEGPTVKGLCNFDKADDNTIIATGRVGGPSFVVRTDDRGDTWQSTDLSGQVEMLIDAEFFDDRTGIILGGTSANITASKTIILLTRNGGRNWRRVFLSDTNSEMGWKADFPSRQIGYISVLSYGQQSSLLKTTDGGETWQVLPFIDGPYQAKGVGFITEDIGWVAGERPGLPAYKTIDGGMTWQTDDSLGALINRFRFVTPRLAFAIGASIYRLRVGE